MDHTYGVRNVADKWMVGNSVLETNQDDSFYIAEKRYRGTPVSYTHLDVYKRQDLHSDYPLAPEKCTITDSMLCLLYTSRCV